MYKSINGLHFMVGGRPLIESISAKKRIKSRISFRRRYLPVCIGDHWLRAHVRRVLVLFVRGSSITRRSRMLQVNCRLKARQGTTSNEMRVGSECSRSSHPAACNTSMNP